VTELLVSPVFLNFSGASCGFSENYHCHVAGQQFFKNSINQATVGLFIHPSPARGFRALSVFSADSVSSTSVQSAERERRVSRREHAGAVATRSHVR
jgi:hypothetical protein